jgi:hypothetical protein
MKLERKIESAMSERDSYYDSLWHWRVFPACPGNVHAVFIDFLGGADMRKVHDWLKVGVSLPSSAARYLFGFC